MTGLSGTHKACAERMRQWGMDTPALVPWRTAAAEVWLGLRDRARAVALLTEELAGSGVTGLPRAYGNALSRLAELVPVGERAALHRRARAALRRAGASAPAPSALAATDPLGLLSAAERRIAALAAAGYSNREIAARAHVTVSTVEQHLTRVYRKLGIRGRDELPVDLVLRAA